MKKDLNLLSVKLFEKGAKGMQVVYAQPITRDGRTFVNEDKSRRKFPIHMELEQTFSWLKPDILKICGYNSEDKNLIAALEITEVKYSESGFVLKGDLNLASGIVTLKTPLISETHQYERLFDVISILDAIYSETKEYLSGNKTIDDAQLVLKFNQGKDGFDAEAFKSLPKEEQKAIATKLLEDSGCIVIQEEDFEEEKPLDENFIDNNYEKKYGDIYHFDAKKSVLVKTNKDTGDQTITSQSNSFPETASSSTAGVNPSAEPVTHTTHVKVIPKENDFQLVFPAEPVKVSTAKRKAS